MKLDRDTKERLKVCFSFLLESYKICMGCFLSVFVAHSCGEQQSCTILESFRQPNVGAQREVFCHAYPLAFRGLDGAKNAPFGPMELARGGVFVPVLVHRGVDPAELGVRGDPRHAVQVLDDPHVDAC